MAYDYMDPMGNYTGVDETDEERRKRLAEEATPVTQTVTTNPVTGDQTMTIKGTPQDLSAANPRTPTVTAPVRPDQVFQRQIQVESGGQQYNPQGGILTSPKGAQGVAQIMPATAANPGYGIRPATPQEIATPEGNMAFGERYKNAMLQLFGGDQQKATAAYNAGPGAVQKAEKQAETAGGSWTDYIPKETTNYLGRVFNNMMPAAQAGTVPASQFQQPPTITAAPAGVSTSMVNPAGDITSQAAAPATTAPAPVNPYAFNVTGGAPGLKLPDAEQQRQLEEKVKRERAMNEFQTATVNPDAMVEYMARKDIPEDLKTAMKINHFEALSAEDRKNKIEQKVIGTITNRPQELPRIINDKTEEGSIAKAFLYSLIGFKSGADAEVAKMNLPGKWETAEDEAGNKGMVLYSTSGKPLQGVTADNKKMTPEELSAYATGGLQKGVHVTKVVNKIDPATGQEYVEQTLSNGKIHTFKGGQRFTGDTTGFTEAGEYNKALDRKVLAADSNLRKNYPNPTDAQRFEALRKAGVPNRRIEEELGYAPGSLAQATPTNARISATPTAAPTAASVSVKPAVGSTVLPSGAAFDPNHAPEQARLGQSQESFKADVKAWETRNKEYTKRVDSIADARLSAEQTLADIDRVLAHPGLPGVVGKMGMLPNIPGGEAANAQAELDKVKGGTFLQAVRNMKGSGSVSNIEGDKAQASIAALSQKQSEDQLRKNLIEYANTIKRTINTANANIGEPPAYPDVPKAGAETGGIRIIKREKIQ